MPWARSVQPHVPHTVHSTFLRFKSAPSNPETFSSDFRYSAENWKGIEMHAELALLLETGPHMRERVALQPLYPTREPL